MMLSRWALMAIPAVSVIAAAALLLGPGRPQAIVGARIWVASADTDGTLPVRVQVVRRQAGFDDGLAEQEVTVELPGLPAPRIYALTGPDGVADAIIECEKPLMGTIPIRVSRKRSTLAQGDVSLHPVRPKREPARDLEGIQSGDLRLTVTLPRGHLVAPFAEPAFVTVRDAGGQPIEGASVRADAPGARITPESAQTNAEGRAELSVLLETLQVQLDVTAERLASDTGAAARGAFQGRLVGAPGAIWMSASKKDASWTLIAPTPRSIAYVTTFTDRGRTHAAQIPMVEDHGFYRGQLSPPEIDGADWIGVIVSPDPFERGDSTVTYPVRPTSGTFTVPPLELVVDGLPAADAAEVARMWQVRRTAFAILALAALVEIVLLVLRSRQSDAALQSHFAQAAQPTGDENSGLSAAERGRLLTSRPVNIAWIVGFAVLVAAAFAVIGVLAWAGP